MDRSMLEYLPLVLRPYRETQGIAAGQQQLLDEVWEQVDRALRNQFLDSADEMGVTRWENQLGINPKDTATLDERKFKIRTILNTRTPYSLRGLREQLGILCGENGYSFSVSGYLVTVRVALGAKESLGDVQKLLNDTLPVNMVLDLSLLYNQHKTLHGFTHRQLGRHTHRQVREEVLAEPGASTLKTE